MILRIRVIPNARKTEIAVRNDEVVLRVKALPVEGKANKAAIEFLARQLGVAKGSVRLLSGEKSRHKIFEIVGLESGDLNRMLAAGSGQTPLE